MTKEWRKKRKKNDLKKIIERKRKIKTLKTRRRKKREGNEARVDAKIQENVNKAEGCFPQVTR